MEYYSDANNYDFSPQSKSNTNQTQFDNDFSGWDRTQQNFYKDNAEDGNISSKKQLKNEKDKQATFAKPVVEVIKRSEQAPIVAKAEVKQTPRRNRFEEDTVYHYSFKKFVPIFFERKKSKYITIKDEKAKQAEKSIQANDNDDQENEDINPKNEDLETIVNEQENDYDYDNNFESQKYLQSTNVKFRVISPDREQTVNTVSDYISQERYLNFNTERSIENGMINIKSFDKDTLKVNPYKNSKRRRIQLPMASNEKSYKYLQKSVDQNQFNNSTYYSNINKFINPSMGGSNIQNTTTLSGNSNNYSNNPNIVNTTLNSLNYQNSSNQSQTQSTILESLPKTKFRKYERHSLTKKNSTTGRDELKKQLDESRLQQQSSDIYDKLLNKLRKTERTSMVIDSQIQAPSISNTNQLLTLNLVNTQYAKIKRPSYKTNSIKSEQSQTSSYTQVAQSVQFPQIKDSNRLLSHKNNVYLKAQSTNKQKEVHDQCWLSGLGWKEQLNIHMRVNNFEKLTARQLYRGILKNVRHYPSRNREMMREAILEDAKEWRQINDELEKKKAIKKMRMLYAHFLLYQQKMEELTSDSDAIDKHVGFTDLNRKKDEDFVYF
ncbi:UNKNOWN [Stylonychia lemnae]|uniref:Uncharacterized protein n=1 Tax=Stylonychia lemnae TaxID=5949 RepID=A0A077ZWN1_STYLE|nr:UNKNOWN [Stylonychia lemnae]|eukprot:CDW74305.1 UNKNOWN [Stylonychia lemnae]